MKKIICLLSLLSIVIYAEEVVSDSSGGKLPQDFSLFDGACDDSFFQRDSIKDKFERYQGQGADYLDYKDLEKLANSTMSPQKLSAQNIKNKKVTWQSAFFVAFQRFIEQYFYAK